MQYSHFTFIITIPKRESQCYSSQFLKLFKRLHNAILEWIKAFKKAWKRLLEFCKIISSKSNLQLGQNFRRKTNKSWLSGDSETFPELSAAFCWCADIAQLWGRRRAAKVTETGVRSYRVCSLEWPGKSELFHPCVHQLSPAALQRIKSWCLLLNDLS